MRDFDLLDSNDWFGVTITGDDSKEPGAEPECDRAIALLSAHQLGIKTWVSHEPVYAVGAVYASIKDGTFIDLLRIGKLNYHPSDIRWGAFGRECELLAQQHGRNIYIKDELRKEMEKGVPLQ